MYASALIDVGYKNLEWGQMNIILISICPEVLNNGSDAKGLNKHCCKDGFFKHYFSKSPCYQNQGNRRTCLSFKF